MCSQLKFLMREIQCFKFFPNDKSSVSTNNVELAGFNSRKKQIVGDENAATKLTNKPQIDMLCQFAHFFKNKFAQKIAL